MVTQLASGRVVEDEISHLERDAGRRGECFDDGVRHVISEG